MNLLKKAKSDPRIKKLLSKINNIVQLKYHKTNDGGWGSNMENKTADIFYSGCKHPSASLAHELLHLDTQIQGYKRIRTFISSIDQTETFKNLMVALDNEFQHHKFYNNFINLGFTPEQFYEDSDINTEIYLNNTLKQSFNKLIDVVPHFLSVIAPGGYLSKVSKQDLKNSFLAINNGQFSKQLLSIENIFVDWSRSNNFDATLSIKKIMLVVQPENNLTWIGHGTGQQFPENGFFVDGEFDVKPPSK